MTMPLAAPTTHRGYVVGILVTGTPNTGGNLHLDLCDGRILQVYLQTDELVEAIAAEVRGPPIPEGEQNSMFRVPRAPTEIEVQVVQGTMFEWKPVPRPPPAEHDVPSDWRPDTSVEAKRVRGWRMIWLAVLFVGLVGLLIALPVGGPTVEARLFEGAIRLPVFGALLLTGRFGLTSLRARPFGDLADNLRETVWENTYFTVTNLRGLYRFSPMWFTCLRIEARVAGPAA